MNASKASRSCSRSSATATRSPERVVDPYVAEEILEASAVDEAVALEVEEEIAGRGLGQSVESTARLPGQQLVDGSGRLARLELHPGLLPHALVALGRAAAGARLERERKRGELRQRRHAAGVELDPLRR